MAITQERMIALISAAERLYHALRAGHMYVNDSLRRLPRDATLEDFYAFTDQLKMFFDQQHVRPDDITLLATERTHFERAHKMNTRNKLAARRRRLTGSGSLSAGGFITPPEPDQLPQRFGLPAPRAPHTITRTGLTLDQLTTHKPTPADFGLTLTGAAAPKPKPMTDEQLLATGAITQLALDKIHCNSLAKQFNMREPYPDPYNDTEPLTEDDARALGRDAPPASGPDIF